MLPTASCTPPSCFGIILKRSPQKTERSPPFWTGEEKFGGESRRAVVVVVVAAVFFRFLFFWVRGQPLTHTFLTKKMVWTITRGRGFGCFNDSERKKDSKKRMGFVVPDLLWSPLFFWMWKSCPKAAQRADGWQGPQCQKAGGAPVMEGSPQGWGADHIWKKVGRHCQG